MPLTAERVQEWLDAYVDGRCAEFVEWFMEQPRPTG
jgi:hypothetical protein